MRRSNFHKSVWIKAREKVGLPDLHFQHATRDRDQAIAKALGAFVRYVRNAADKQPDTGEREEKEA